MGSPLIPIYATPSVCVPWLQDSDEQAVEALGGLPSVESLSATVCRTVALPLSASYRFRSCKSAATVQVAVGALPPWCEGATGTSLYAWTHRPHSFLFSLKSEPRHHCLRRTPFRKVCNTSFTETQSVCRDRFAVKTRQLELSGSRSSSSSMQYFPMQEYPETSRTRRPAAYASKWSASRIVLRFDSGLDR